MMPGWYDMNSGRAYPFREDPLLDDVDVLPVDALVDAEFVLGVAADADPDTEVSLVSVQNGGDSLTFVFQYGGTHEFVFTVATDAAKGSLQFATATPVGGGPADAGFGAGFIVVGDLTALAPLVASAAVVTQGRVEAARVQSEARRNIRSVSFANDPEVDVVPCGGSLSSSSGDGAGGAGAVPVSGLVGLTGIVMLSAGYNATVRATEVGNRLVLGAHVGAGIDPREPGNTGLCDDFPRTAGPTPDVCKCLGLVYSINGVVPGADGDIPVFTGPGLSVTADGSTLRIRVDTNVVFQGCV